MARLFEKSKYVLPGSQSWEMSSKMCFSNSVPMSSIPLPDATLRWNNQESYQDLKIIEDRAIFVWPWNKNARTKQKQQTNGNRAIWLVYRPDTNALGFWLVKQTLGWKNFMPENWLSRNTSILCFDVILQHDWPINTEMSYLWPTSHTF